MRVPHPAWKRRGTIVPYLAVSVIAIFAAVALAIDLGLVAVSRNHCQNAADIGAMAGVRVLDGESANNNVNAAQPAARNAVTANSALNRVFTAGDVTAEVGYYAYDIITQRFVATFTGTKPADESWSAVRVTVSTQQPTYFARLFNITAMPAAAQATAVHRPRDVALVLDFSGSMRFSSETAYPSSGTISGSLNPDPEYPKFGPWSVLGGQMQRTTLYVDGGGETHAPNNFTMETENGPAVVRDFLTRDGSGSLVNAFHRPTSPYDWRNEPDNWATPAPADFDVQSDATATFSGVTGMGGDKWPRMNNNPSGAYARTVKEYLTGGNSWVSTTHPKSVLFETLGYGLDFAGYTVGPGYYGKTFYIWPPDPRPAWDWRRRFFYFDGTTTPVDDNYALWDSSGYWRSKGSGAYEVNYDAVVAWLKSGPQVLPPNLRAGRVLYYSSIPDTIPQSGGSQDQRFWRAYIDHVLGTLNSTQRKRTLYGQNTTSWGTVRITRKSDLNSDPAQRPYMYYRDNPKHQRLHFWFGPLTMMDFLAETNYHYRNWWPGTSHEAQTWQLKAGIQSALNDIQRNHPNDWVALIYFSALNEFNTSRVTMSRDYGRMRDALFFPFSLLNNLGEPNAEVRPYTSTFGSTSDGEIPNGHGGTSPEMGFKLAYNEFSSALGFSGRRGASKLVIFETDGVPNTLGDGNFVNGGPYNSYYTGISRGSGLGNNHPTVVSNALALVSQICAADTAPSPGYSSARVPARVHALAFGDLFQSGSFKKDQALDFLLQVQKAGNTSPAGATGIESYKIITGNFATRIDNLRLALERIVQSGIQVSLIE